MVTFLRKLVAFFVPKNCVYGKKAVILQPISVISILESTRNPTCSKMELVRTLAKIATVEVTT